MKFAHSSIYLKYTLMLVASLILTFASCAQLSESALGSVPLVLLESVQTTSTQVVITDWWTDGDAYIYRKKINFGNSHSALPQYYTISFTMNTLASEGVALTSGDDVRVIYQAADGTATELDRLGSNWNGSSTTIDFRLSTAVALNEDQPDSGSYYVYYGNASAGSPPADEADVYYYMDSFSRADGVVGNSWTSWDDGSGGIASLVSSALTVAPQADGSSAGARVVFALGAIPGDFTVSFSWDMPANGEVEWVYMLGLGSSAFMVDNNRTGGIGPGLYNCEDTSLNCTLARLGMYNTAGGQLELDIQGSHTFQMDVNRTAYTYDYTRDGVLRSSNVPFVNNIDTIDQLRISGDSVNAGVGEEHTFDDVKIVLKVDTAPTITLDAAQSR